VRCVELSDSVISESKKVFPKIIFYNNIKKVNVNEIDGFIIATPTKTHFKLAVNILKMGKPVWLEKPATSSLEELLKIKALSLKFNTQVFVDFTYSYDEGINHLKRIVENNMKNNIYQIRSIRTNYGIFRNDDSVVEDLAVHDLVILRYLFNSEPIGVSATGSSSVKGKLNDTAIIHLFFPQNRHGYVTVSWQAPTKTRMLEIITNKEMLVYKESGKYRQYDYYRKENSVFKQKKSATIKLKTESLQTALKEYLLCIINYNNPKTGLVEAEKIRKVLDDIELSISNSGKFVAI
jgi:predicted dehydrogenase